MRRLAKLDTCRTIWTLEIQVQRNRGLRLVIVSGPYIEVWHVVSTVLCQSAVMLLLCTSRPSAINFKMQESPMSCCSGGNSVSIHCIIDMQIWNVRGTGTRESLIFCPNGRRFVTLERILSGPTVRTCTYAYIVFTACLGALVSGLEEANTNVLMNRMER